MTTLLVSLTYNITQQLEVIFLLLYKAVATDFEVVRPGSGCGLFSVGVVCSVWVWFCLLDIMLVLKGSPWIDQLNAI